MLAIKRAIDHIVFGVPDLNFGIQYFEEKLGVTPVFGGYHKTQGTKNALLNLSDECYLEIIAIDPDNLEVNQDRWMGIDLLEGPKLIRWAIKSSNLRTDQAILRNYHSAMGEIEPGSRLTASGELLQWELIMPLSTPEVEVIPFVLDWSQSEMHPTEALESTPFKLNKIQLTHPKPEMVSTVLEDLHAEAEVIQGNKMAIHAVLQGPAGSQVL